VEALLNALANAKGPNQIAKALYDYYKNLDKNSEDFKEYGTELASNIRQNIVAEHTSSPEKARSGLLEWRQVANNLARYSDYYSAAIIWNTLNEASQEFGLEESSAISNTLNSIIKEQSTPEAIADKLFLISADYYNKLDVVDAKKGKEGLDAFTQYLESDLQLSIASSIVSKPSAKEKQDELERWIQVMDKLVERGDYSASGQIRMTIEKLKSSKGDQELQQAFQGLSADSKKLLGGFDATKLGKLSYYSEQKQAVTIPYPTAMTFTTQTQSEGQKMQKIQEAELKRSVAGTVNSKTSVKEKQSELEHWIKEIDNQRRRGDYKSAAEIRSNIDNLRSSKNDKELTKAFKSLNSDSKKILKNYSHKSLSRLSQLSSSAQKGVDKSVTFSEPSDVQTQEKTKLTDVGAKLNNFFKRTRERANQMKEALSQSNPTLKNLMMHRVKLKGMEEDLQELKKERETLKTITMEGAFKKALNRLEKYKDPEKLMIAAELMGRFAKAETIEDKVRELTQFINVTSKQLTHSNFLNAMRNKEFGLVTIAKEMRDQLITSIVESNAKIRSQERSIKGQEEILNFYEDQAENKNETKDDIDEILGEIDEISKYNNQAENEKTEEFNFDEELDKALEEMAKIGEDTPHKRDSLAFIDEEMERAKQIGKDKLGEYKEDPLAFIDEEMERAKQIGKDKLGEYKEDPLAFIDEEMERAKLIGKDKLGEYKEDPLALIKERNEMAQRIGRDKLGPYKEEANFEEKNFIRKVRAIQNQKTPSRTFPEENQSESNIIQKNVDFKKSVKGLQKTAGNDEQNQIETPTTPRK
jgi:hypothetical protein